jgi:hypothetical protein
MTLDAASVRVTLCPGQVLSWNLRAGTRLRGLRGSAWLTRDGDRRDIVLGARDEWVLEHDGRLLACALQADGAAVVQLDEPRGARR